MHSSLTEAVAALLKYTWKPLNPSIIKGDVWKSILDDGQPRLVKKKRGIQGERKKNFRNQLKVVRDELNFMATCTTCSTTTPNLTLFFSSQTHVRLEMGKLVPFFAAAPSFQQQSHKSFTFQSQWKTVPTCLYVNELMSHVMEFRFIPSHYKFAYSAKIHAGQKTICNHFTSLLTCHVSRHICSFLVSQLTHEFKALGGENWWVLIEFSH